MSKTPTSKKSWLKISQNFEERWNIPSGIGADDGTHIFTEQSSSVQDATIEIAKAQVVSMCLQWAGLNTISCMCLLELMVETQKAEFLVDGLYLKTAFDEDVSDIPNPVELPSRNKKSIVCTGDSAFPISTYTMKPFL